MKFAILNDETIETWTGGAALVNDKICTSLKEKGHECVIWIYGKNNKPEDLPKDLEFNQIDHFLFANIAYYPFEFMNKIMDTKPFSTFRHDIPIILYTKPPSIFLKTFYDLWGKMFVKAKITFFISPMQKKVFEQTFAIGRSVIIPPPLDMSSFTNEKRKDRSGALYVGDISAGRGCEQALSIMKQRYPNGPWTFVGQPVHDELVKYLKTNGAMVLKATPRSDMPNIMNSHKTLIYLPVMYDSFCLKILEAELCGMEIISDTLCIGRYGYSQKAEDVVKLMKQAVELIVKELTTKFPKESINETIKKTENVEAAK